MGVMLATMAVASPATAQTGVLTYNAYMPAAALAPDLLPPPPAEKTPAHKKQLALVRAAQKNIGTDDMTALLDEQKLVITHITSVVGVMDENRYPLTFALLKRTLKTAEESAARAKKFWHTRRPYLVDKHIKLLVDPVDASPAYPSGHTAAARLLASTLGLVVPDKRTILLARADKIAWHRVQAGVHYPNDLDGGRFLAGMLLGALLQDPNFQADVNAAAGEITANPIPKN